MINIRLRGLRDLSNNIEKLRRAFENSGEILEQEAVPAISEETRNVFSSRGYGRWAPLSPRTIAEKGHDRPLIRTKRYIRAATDPNHSDNSIQIRKNTLRYNVNVPYASYHEFGTRRIPARPIFRLIENNARFRRRLSRRIDSAIQKVVNNF